MRERVSECRQKTCRAVTDPSRNARSAFCKTCNPAHTLLRGKQNGKIVARDRGVVAKSSDLRAVYNKADAPPLDAEMKAKVDAAAREKK